jgi:hypothetical protein
MLKKFISSYVKKHSFIKNSIVIVVGLAISAEGGYPRLDKIVSCRGEAPELKDAFEAAMRARGPFGHVCFFFRNSKNEKRISI